MEGVSSEAASLAGHQRLGRLIYLYDDNHITIDGTTELAFTEDRVKRFEAYGWHTVVVPDGNDVEAIDKAIAGRQEGSAPVADRLPHAYRLRPAHPAGQVLRPRRTARR